ncbi:MAG: hypothetical protein OXF05_04140 [Hyphomicrobiales bacterium]|nr:hypothetical protein [Hyphomicrobiales bacterium]
MKTIMTAIFAIVLTVFAFNANPVTARTLGNLFIFNQEQANGLKDSNEVQLAFDLKCTKGYVKRGSGCEWDGKNEDDLLWADREAIQAEKERDIADSGEEGSTSAASEITSINLGEDTKDTEGATGGDDVGNQGSDH